MCAKPVLTYCTACLWVLDLQSAERMCLPKVQILSLWMDWLLLNSTLGCEILQDRKLTFICPLLRIWYLPIWPPSIKGTAHNFVYSNSWWNFKLNSQWNCSLVFRFLMLCFDWLELCMASSMPLCLFTIFWGTTANDNQFFFLSQHTLVNHKEHLPTFNKAYLHRVCAARATWLQSAATVKYLLYCMSLVYYYYTEISRQGKGSFLK